MNFLNRIFRSNLVDCPRCLGKGHVDADDIKRLKKELFWAAGKCAYCNGIGKVPPDRMEKVEVDFEYLTTELPSWERHKVIQGDENARKRANEFKAWVERFIDAIERLYYIENYEPGEIADHFFRENGRMIYTAAEKQEIVEYIDKVLKSKLKG